MKIARKIVKPVQVPISINDTWPGIGQFSYYVTGDVLAPMWNTHQKGAVAGGEIEYFHERLILR